MPAIVPGALVGIHYAVQIARPRWGYGSDRAAGARPGSSAAWRCWRSAASAPPSRRRCAETHQPAGLALAVARLPAVGIGVGAAGTSLLVLLATSVAPERRAAAATIVWLMMIVGIAVTAPPAGHFLDPFSIARLVAVTGTVVARRLR